MWTSSSTTVSALAGILLQANAVYTATAHYTVPHCVVYTSRDAEERDEHDLVLMTLFRLEWASL